MSFIGKYLFAHPGSNLSAANLALIFGSSYAIQDVGYVKYVVEQKGTDINSIDWWGASALHLSVFIGHMDITSYLLEKGADIDIKAIDGHTPLSIVASIGNLKSVKFLLENGADVNADDKIIHSMIDYKNKNLKALNKQIQENFEPILKLLVEHGIKLTPFLNHFIDKDMKFNEAQQIELQEFFKANGAYVEPEKTYLQDSNTIAEHMDELVPNLHDTPTEHGDGV